MCGFSSLEIFYHIVYHPVAEQGADTRQSSLQWLILDVARVQIPYPCWHTTAIDYEHVHLNLTNMD